MSGGNVRYFEPAVLAAPNVEEARMKVKLWAQIFGHGRRASLDNTIAYQSGETPQRTLVLIKPDNFRFPTGRPGNVIDFFSRTGLYIVGIKVHRMSVAEAMEFYGPVKEVLRTQAEGRGRCRAPKRRWKRNSASRSARNEQQATRRDSRPALRRQPV